MYTPIQLDKARNLRYGYMGLSLIEEALGMNINKVLIKATKGDLSIKETFTMIWAGLYHEDKELTVEKVIDLVDEYSDIETVSELMGKAIEKSLAKKENNEKNVVKVASKK